MPGESSASGAHSEKAAILVVDDELDSVDLLRITLGMDYTVYTATSGQDALSALAEHPDIALAIIDQRMPEMSGVEFIRRTLEPYPDLVRVILTGFTDIDSLIDAINAGSVYRYLTKPWNKDELLGVIAQGLEKYRLERENVRLQEELRRANGRLRVENAQLRCEAKGRNRFDGIVGNSTALGKSLALAERVARSDTTVLILSETGTGKDLLARAIHYNGPRADGPFVAESCVAIAKDLSSELFGHKKGAFTDAIEDRAGLFEQANGGTLFLDEIGDCSVELQSQLLRVIEEREVRRVGENIPRSVDVRLIAATHHDLEKDVAEGKFRQDLFFRLDVFSLSLPPLRERKEDIPLLAQHFVDQFNRSGARRVLGCTSEALDVLSAHDFPGNVRELANEIARAFVLADDDSYISADMFSKRIDRAPGLTADGNASSFRNDLERYEAGLLRDALERNSWNRTKTAEDLGITRRALFDKIRKFKLGVASQYGDPQ